MGNRVVLDTNILLKVVNKESGYASVVKILDQVDKGNINAFLSAVTIAEVAVGYYRSGDEAGLKDFLLHIRSHNKYSVVEVDMELGELAGKIRASTGLRLPDAIIAASGMISEANWVITEDTHFKQASSFVSPITPDEFVNMNRCETS